MSYSTGINSLKMAVKRLEDAAGKGQMHCPSCRLYRRYILIDPKKPRPRPKIPVDRPCNLCQAKYTIDLADLPEEVREVYRWYYSLTIEDQYKDPKAHALSIWLAHRPRKTKPAKKWSASAAAQGLDHSNKAGKAQLAKFEAEVETLIDNIHKRSQAKYKVSYPAEQWELAASIFKGATYRNKTWVDHPGENYFELETARTRHLVCAEMEKIIWGKIRTSTASAIKKLEQEIDESIITGQEAHAREEEEKARWYKEELFRSS